MLYGNKSRNRPPMARSNVHHAAERNRLKPKKSVHVLRFDGPINVFQWLNTRQGMRPRINGESELGRAISKALRDANPRDVLVVKKDSPAFGTSFSLSVQKIGTGEKGPIYKVIGGYVRLNVSTPEAIQGHPDWALVKKETGLKLSPEMFLSKRDPLFQAVKRAFKERPSARTIAFPMAYDSGVTIVREFERVENKHGIFYHLAGVSFEFTVRP